MKYYRINNSIKLSRARIIDEDGKNLGIMPITKAQEIANYKNLDLVEINADSDPPICKIIDFGKFLYQQQKKSKKAKRSKLKTIKIGFTTGPHDLLIKAKKATELLTKNNLVKIELILRGRQKGLKDLAKSKIEEILKLIEVDYKIDSPLKVMPYGITLIVAKK